MQVQRRPSDPMQDAVRVEACQRLLSAMAALAPVDRRIIESRYGEDRTLASVACELGLTTKAVERRAAKSKRKLRTSLSRYLR